MSKLKRLNILTAIWGVITITGFATMGHEYVYSGIGGFVNIAWFVAMVFFT